MNIESNISASNQIFFEAKDIDEAINGLLRKMRITSGARFCAATRHKKRYRTSTISIVVLSLYSILFSIISVFVDIDKPIVDSLLSMISVFMSVMVIAFSLMEASKRHDYRSDLFMDCAQEILRLHDRIKIEQIKGSIDYDRFMMYLDNYHNQINSFLDNHSQLDKDYYEAKYSSYKIRNTYIKILYYSNIWLLPVIAFMSPAIIVILVLLAKMTYSIF